MSVRQKIFFPIICLILVELASLSPVSEHENDILTAKERSLVVKDIRIIGNNVKYLNEKVTDMRNYIKKQFGEADDDDDDDDDNDNDDESDEDPTHNYDEHLVCFKNCDDEANYPDCQEATEDYENNGIFLLDPFPNELEPFYVYCIYEDQFFKKSWTVIQRRKDGTENFFRNWHDYKSGFGKVHNEYWIGNERLHEWTKSCDYELMIEMTDFSGKSYYVLYKKFAIASVDDEFTLTIGGFETNNEKMEDELAHHNNDKFSTYDHQGDRSYANCPQEESSGWWFSDCSSCNLNGRYFSHANKKSAYGIRWGEENRDSLQSVTMLIRPVDQ